MAESRSRESLFASQQELLHSIVEIDPRTAVPKESSSAADHLGTGGQGGPVICVLSSYAGPVPADLSSQLKPYYDSARRELSLAGFVLKRFRKPAGNQEAILKTFQDDGDLNGGLWPPRIDDPISGQPPEPIRRLHDALNALNAAIAEEAVRSAAPHYIEFFTDGTGQGILWKIVAVSAG
jgi:hypothetical protein